MSSLRTNLFVVNQTINGQPGRDNGGMFELREMAAVPASDWFMRAMQFLVRSGTDVPPHIFEAGPAGFFAIGIGTALSGVARAPWFEVKDLLRELFGCVVTYTPPGGSVPLSGWAVIETQILEAATIFQLYEEVVSLSLGFSLAGELSTWRDRITTTLAAFMQNTETSTGESASSLEAASPPLPN